ncbi:hypothetical protein [Luteithermobacter gelatinilyticus]|uniref:hypothetical protein n=1 Tax=Luteithermobacter gelatinilyticus TaxID=2582913 RepID=UPI00143E0CDD|nr:hypothetical protein [Luteithermobacter gelatinilyticus]
MSNNKKSTRQEKQDRLAEALRANLKRRKAQSRKAQDHKTTPPGKKSGPTDTQS